MGLSQVHFFDRLKVWYAKDRFENTEVDSEQGNVIGLSDSFWQEIQAHPIPVDLNLVRGLTNNPGCLDLYMRLVWRCFSEKHTNTVPLFGSFGLAAQLGYSRGRRRVC